MKGGLGMQNINFKKTMFVTVSGMVSCAWCGRDYDKGFFSGSYCSKKCETEAQR